MKIITIIGLTLISSLGFSQVDSTEDKPDTEIKFGKMTLIFDEDEKEADINNGNGSKKYPSVEFLPSFDYGVAGFSKANVVAEPLTTSYRANEISSQNIALDFGKSRNFAVNLNLTFNLTKNFGVVTGARFSNNTYVFKNNVMVLPKTGAFQLDTVISYSKYRFRNNYIELPVMLKLQSSNEDFQFAFGGSVGYNYRSKVKATYSIDGGEYKLKVKDNFNTEPLRFNVGARFNYRGFGLYFNYGFTKFHAITESDGTQYNTYDLMPFEAGITLGSF